MDKQHSPTRIYNKRIQTNRNAFMKNKHSLYDSGIEMWGGSMDEGLSRNSTFCPGYNDVAGYIDKMLPAKLRKSFENHMAACRDCRTDILELRICIRETM
jgi:hypothetical protein